jgi:hypothetical protein
MCRGFLSQVAARLMPRLIAGFLVLAVTPRVVLAQYNTAEMSGVVKDVQGAVMPGAHVEALHVASGLKTERVTEGADPDVLGADGCASKR